MSAIKTVRAVCALALALSVSSTGVMPAFAASAAASATTQPKPQVATGPPVTTNAGGPVDVQVWPAEENGETAVLVAVQVPETTKLPTVVRVPLMSGTNVQWAGEVLGGDPNADPARAYVLRNGIGGTFAEFTLTKSHRAQVDSLGLPLAVKGSTTFLSATWVQSVNSSLTAISVRVPAGAFQIKVKPAPAAAPSTNSSGESLYALNPKTFKLGEKQDISLSYSSTPPAAGGSVGMTPLLIGLGSALAIAVLVLFVVITRQRQSAGAEHDEAQDAPEPRPSRRAKPTPAEEEAPPAEEPGQAAHDEPDEEPDEASDEDSDEDDDTDLSWD